MIRPLASQQSSERQGVAPKLPLWLLYPLFFVGVFLSHYTLLRLPYFWDEGGYYIPAALDFFHTGTLIPHSTLTNAHPPLPSILLAGWWHLSGFVISGTRTLICLVAAAALLAVFRTARYFAGDTSAAVTALLTATYPIWFVQSTLAHADIFAAAFTLWALSFYLTSPRLSSSRENVGDTQRRSNVLIATLFALAALSKETAIVTPVSLAIYEALGFLRRKGSPGLDRGRIASVLALLSPIVPLAGWYGFHFVRTGYVFGNPEFLRYNATANFDAHRILLCLWHRVLHLTTHMNMFVPVLCTFAAILRPVLAGASERLPNRVLNAISVVLVANLLAFSVLGGALLTRYLLPMYPLLLLVSVIEWRRHLRLWWAVAGLSLAAFLGALWLNPPYAFAPEDNLTYREMIVLHRQAIRVIENRFPNATVLTAWPANAELERPYLGYTKHSFKTTSLTNFSSQEIQRAASEPGSFDTALIFSTKWEPPAGKPNLGKQNEPSDAKYFDFHRDLRPEEIAVLLGGEVVWQAERKGEWAAVLHFPRIVSASKIQPGAPPATLYF